MGGQWLILLSLVLGVSSSLPSESNIDRRRYYCKRTDHLVHSHCVVNGLCVCSPDDFNADCRTNPRFAPEHILPDEWELMLDSHDYQNLIQDTNPAWIRRDVDGDGGQWTQRGGICQYDLRTCSYRRGPQNNWIFSQYIKYPAGSITHSTEISLDITFRFSQCTGNPACTNDFVTLYRFDTNTIVPLSAHTNPANYIPMFGSGTDSHLQQVGFRNVNIMRKFTIPGDYTGFYLGIRDTGTCGQVQRVYLYYTPCKELLDGLVYYPELVRPPISTNSCYTAEACCAPNSHSTTSPIYRACSDGRCERNVTCECDPGYTVDSSGKECNCCSAGTYRSPGDPQGACLRCPKNTVMDLECAPLCPCIDGYYRRADEAPGEDCTRAPTAVRGLRVDTIRDTSVIITWNRPEVIGRDDFYYIIKYTDIANFDQNLNTDPISARYVNSAPTVSLRVPSIASGLELRPNTDYIIKVIVHNGVSDQESENEPLRKRDITVKTMEGVPSVPLGVRPLPGVVVWGPPANPNGDITGYDVRFLDRLSRRRHDTIPKTPIERYHIVSDSDITGLGNNIRVQVRAKTSAGAGPWSDEQDYIPACPLPGPNQCPSLPNPSNGVVKISTSPVGVVATYSCLSGYSLVGPSSRTCQPDGSWSGQQPRCIDPYPTDIYPYDPYEPYDPYDPYPFYFCELNEDEYGRPYFGPYDEYRRPNRSTSPPNVYVRPNTTTVLPPRETYEPDYEELAKKNRGRTLTLPSCITSNECGQVPETCSGSGTRYDSCGRRCTCRNNRLQDCCRVRKEWRSMTQVERCRYVSVVVAVSTQQPWKMCYDELIKIHRDEFRAGSGIHSANFFLPWHRWYILAFENLLRQIDCHVTVPYWDWSLEPQTWQNSILWATECGLGGNGNPNNNDHVETGPFRQGTWQLTPSANNDNGGSLRRRFNGDLPDSASVALDQRFGVSSFDTWERFVRINLHNAGHCIIGGTSTMCNVDSANAPEFFLHHGFIDQIWGAWQNKGPAFKNLPFYSANVNPMPGAFRNSPQDVYDLKNQPGCVRVCVEPSSRPSRANTTFTPTCPREMNCYDYSPIKLAGIIPRPYPRVPEEAFRLFNTSYAVRRTSNRFADILNDYDELYSVLQANGYASTSSYRPAYGEIQFDRYLYQPQITSYNPELPQPPLECRPYLPPHY